MKSDFEPRRALLFGVALILFPLLLSAQVDTAWARRLSGPASQSDWAYCLAPDGNGGVYVSGSYTQSSSNSDWATIHYLANGDTDWVRLWTSPGTRNERSNAIVVGPSGNLYLVGYTMLAGNGDYNTIKYSSSGDTVWRQAHNGVGLTRYDFGSTIVLDDSENVIVSGYSGSVDYTYAYATVKYNKDGVQRWAVRACTSGASYPALAVDDSCNIILAGYTQLPGQGDDDLVVIKYRSDGSIAWRRYYNGPGDSTDRANAVAVDAAGNIYVAGYTFSTASGNDFVVQKYNRQGDTLWTRRYNGPANLGDQGIAIAVSPAGDIYVAGNSTGSTSSSDFLLIKYNQSGDTLWTGRYNGPGNSADNVDAGLVLDILGGIYLGGGSQGSGTMGDFCVVKYDAAGGQQWIGRYDGPDHLSDMARGLGVDELGNAFICGTSNSTASSYDMATVKFVQQGFAPGNVGATALLAPAGVLDSGQTVTPACSTFNYDTLPATYNVRLKIGTQYNQTARVTSHAPGARAYVTFPDWTALGRGSFGVSCSTELAGDAQPENDRATGSVFLNAHDVGVSQIIAPAGDIDSGAAVTPRATVRNLGNVTETLAVDFAIGYGYFQTIFRTVEPDAESLCTFPDWTAQPRGALTAVCSTRLAGDGNPANNRIVGELNVLVHDAAAEAIVAPLGSLLPGAVSPQARVRNRGNLREGLDVEFAIQPGAYLERVSLAAGLPDNADTVITFPDWNAVPGSYVAYCRTLLSGDQVPHNDSTGVDFVVNLPPDTGWTRKADLPLGPKGKRVKDGACLAYDRVSDTDFVYALKGNNRCEFYAYAIEANVWTTRESIPAVGSSGKKKAVKKGGRLGVGDVPRYGTRFFATKGAGTLEFWQYTPETLGVYPWCQKPDVPAGSKTVKNGSGLVKVRRHHPHGDDTVFIYLLKSSSTNEFYRYDVLAGTWQTLPNAPTGVSGKPFKAGSGIIQDDLGRICALKGTYNEFYAYSLDSGTWTTLASLPLTGSAGKKKAKDGASLAYHDGYIYALKGGNTLEFWRYEVDSNRWQEIASMPLGGGKKVKGGGALTTAEDAMFAFKGSNTQEFFRYGPVATCGSPLTAYRQNAMSDRSVLPASYSLAISPNPFSGTARISYALPRAGPVSLRLYDVSGKLVRTLINGCADAGRSAITVPRSALASGIYLLKLSTADAVTTAKLIIE